MNGTLHVSPYETFGEAEYRQINRHPLLSQRLAVVHLHDGIQAVDGQSTIPANLSGVSSPRTFSTPACLA